MWKNWIKLVQHGFDHGGPLYDRFAAPLARRLHARVVDDVTGLGLPDGATVLDAGTGPGRLAIALARTGLSVTGLDLSPSMVEQARRNAQAAGITDRVTFEVGDVAALPYPDRSFDLVVSTAALHHWTRPATAARELLRVLRPGGRLWVYDARSRFPQFTGALEALTGAPPRREIAGTGLLRWVARISTAPDPDQAAT